MLRVYGSLMPLRVLEEIRFWKTQEHTVVIRELVPTLEPSYRQQLARWEGVFARTEASATQLIEAVVRSNLFVSPQVWGQVNALLDTSIRQSLEFVRQLFALLETSAAVKRIPTAPVVIRHIIRESEYFIGVLHAVTGTANQ